MSKTVLSATTEELVFIGICDLAAQVRGKAVPLADLKARMRKGVGYTPANICISAFGTIRTSPFGTLGDTLLVPSASTEVDVRLEDGGRERFYLADIVTLDGDPWPYCPREFLRGALKRLENATGFTLLASFEQEFVYTGVSAEPRRAYALESFRDQGKFGAELVAALRAAGMEPEAFLAEYGPRQYEISVAPKVGMRAADEAVILRELARAVARRHAHRAVFAPMLSPDGIGNGTHIHLSLRDAAGEAVMHATEGHLGLSSAGEAFVAGILAHLPALAAVTTPSVASYFRLTPGRWAPTAANVGAQDRGASLRICPGPGMDVSGGYNVEVRVADATACPYLALGALVHAGVDGIERELRLADVPDSPLPRSLDEALGLLRATAAAGEWFGAEFLQLYLNFKAEEVEALQGVAPQEICDRYAAVY